MIALAISVKGTVAESARTRFKPKLFPLTSIIDRGQAHTAFVADYFHALRTFFFLPDS